MRRDLKFARCCDCYPENRTMTIIRLDMNSFLVDFANCPLRVAGGWILIVFPGSDRIGLTARFVCHWQNTVEQKRMMLKCLH